MTGGRPLRFLALALGGWVMIRGAFLLPEIGSRPTSEVIPRLVEVLVPKVAAAALGRRNPGHPFTASERPARSAIVPHAPPPPRRPAPPQPPPQDRRSPSSPVGAIPTPRPEVVRQVDGIPSPVAPPTSGRRPTRLNGSVWLLVRGGAGGTVSGGQLGASQGGARITYALGDQRRFALVARIATPLRGAGREAAFGMEWQPTRLPIRIVAEQRVVLDGGRGGPTLGVIAGYGPADIAPGIRLETYGQAGAIARDGVEAFVDASARLTHPLGKLEGVRVDIGLGAWGSAQRGAKRFDIGPSLVATVPVARRSIRLALDWRERIAGTARPGSGPAVSIGSDF